MVNTSAADEFDEPKGPTNKSGSEDPVKDIELPEKGLGAAPTAAQITIPIVHQQKRRSLLDIQIDNIRELYGSIWCMSFRRILYLIHKEDARIHEYFGEDARLFLEWEVFHEWAPYGVDNLLYLACLPFFYIAFFLALIYRVLECLYYDVDWSEFCGQCFILFFIGLCLTTQNIVRMGITWVIMPFLLFTPHPFPRLLRLKIRFKFVDSLRK